MEFIGFPSQHDVVCFIQSFYHQVIKFDIIIYELSAAVKVVVNDACFETN